MAVYAAELVEKPQPVSNSNQTQNTKQAPLQVPLVEDN
jgi:hypothetical protein